MKPQKILAKNKPAIGLASNAEHLFREQIKFTAPTIEPAPDLVPQIRIPLLTDTTRFDREITAFQNGDTIYYPGKPPQPLDKSVVAQAAIEAKAEQLKWVGAATSEITQTGEGFLIRFEAADIYYSAVTGAHEVHGDIRAKYNAFGAATGALGLPTTDETETPDNNGRFNHFQGGSIYWTPKTGAMTVRGAIRDKWAAQGWENSSLGYPIADQVTKNGNPPQLWGGFQNGAIYSEGNITEEAVFVEIEPLVLADLVRKVFDKELKAADSDLGINGGVNILNVSDWGFGFWESVPRTITYEINGFYSNGIPLLPDPTFRLELNFQFELLWRKTPSTEPPAADCSPLRATLRDLEAELAKLDKFINEPIPGEQHPPKPVLNGEWTIVNKRVLRAKSLLTACENSNTTNLLTLSEVDKTLIIYLSGWHISTAGAFNGELFEQLVKKIPESFPFAVKTIPANALLIDVLVTPTGGLKFLLLPEPFGKIRRDIFETELNHFIEES